MKKRIKDLKLGDPVYKSYAGITTEYQVYSISNENLVLRKNKDRYDEEVFKMKQEDLTRFQFESSDSYKYKFFLSRLDALKESRGWWDRSIERLFERQENFLKKIKDTNDSIRVVDEQIAEELKSTL